MAQFERPALIDGDLWSIDYEAGPDQDGYRSPEEFLSGTDPHGTDIPSRPDAMPPR